MGLLNSKSPLERRNTVMRRSQRKSIHGIKSKAERVARDIKKFNGTDNDTAYNSLQNRIEQLQKELVLKESNLQPQVCTIYSQTRDFIDNLEQVLADKVRENQESVKGNEVEEEKPSSTDGSPKPELRQNNIALKIVQVTTDNVENDYQKSPEQKRQSVMRMGVAVMPGSIMQEMHRKSEQEVGDNEVDHVAKIRQRIADVENEISQFVGRKFGAHYNRLKGRLSECQKELDQVPEKSEDISEQVKLCTNYIASCLSFLDEKSEDEEDDVFVGEGIATSPNNIDNNNLVNLMKTSAV